MNVIDFCNKNGILWFPINIKLTKRDDGTFAKDPLYTINYMPKTIDFENLSKEQIKFRQDCMTDEIEYVAIDTARVKHLDVDFKDDYVATDREIQDVEEWKSQTPYFKSTSKRQGLHALFTTAYDFNGSKRAQTHLSDHIEILNGQWSYCKKDALVYNTDVDIIDYDAEDVEPIHKKDGDVPSGDNKLNKEIPNASSTIEKPKFDNEHQNFLTELTEIINQDLIDLRDSWIRLVWALANDNDYNNYEIARYLSARSPKYEEIEFNKIWSSAKTRISIGTFIYYARESNEKQFFKKKALTMVDWINLDSEVGLAKIFLGRSETDYIVKRENCRELYSFHRGKWLLDSKSAILKCRITNDLSKFLVELRGQTNNRLRACIENLGMDNPEVKDMEAKIHTITSCLTTIMRTKQVNNIAESVLYNLACINFDDIEFDQNGYLFAFRDKVLDLKSLNFIETRREDFILTTTGFDYESVEQEDVNELNKLIESIFPNPEIRDYYLKVLSTCLYGIPVEQLFIANGGGGNGKGVINELMEELLGNYAYTAPIGILLGPLKTGNNPEVANMNKKRMVIFREPPENAKICWATAKEITGGKQINARKNYSNDTKTEMHAAQIIECNKKPGIDGRLDESALRRLRDVPFESTFTNDTKLLEQKNLQNVYPANSFYKSSEFRKQYKFALFKILVDYIRDFKEKYNCLPIEKMDAPEVIMNRSRDYISASDPIKEWFDEQFELIANPSEKKKDIIQNKEYLVVKDLLAMFKSSNYFLSSSKREQRQWTNKYFQEYLQTSINFKMYYHPLLKSGEERIRTPVLINWREKIEEEEMEEE
jgi:phage/plasmid-associated DNA primase